MVDFYDTSEASEMADAYRQQAHNSLMKVDELLQEADITEKRIEMTHKILMRRRRMRLEIKLQRILLAVLMLLSPENQELGTKVYERLSTSVDRLEKLC